MKEKLIYSVFIVSILFANFVYSDTNSEEETAIDDLLRKAFSRVQTTTLPLNGDQITTFKKNADSVAESVLPGKKAKLSNKTISVNLVPGEQGVSIKTALGYASAITIVDSTGQPWPIDSYTPGNKNWFNVVSQENNAGNALTVVPLIDNVNSNITVSIKDQSTPIVFELDINENTQDRIADGLTTVVVNHFGPNAIKPTIGKPVPTTLDSETLAFLDGVPPAGAKSIKLKDAPIDINVWQFKEKVYCRTPYLMRWPSYLQEVKGNGNLHLYIAPLTDNIVLAVNGESKIINFAR